MQHKHNFNTVDRTLRDVMDTDDLFGGIPVILGGDYAQMLPVVRRDQREDIVNACIWYWQHWRLIMPLFLTQNMRVVESELNHRFAEWLSHLSYSPSQRGLIDFPDWIQTTFDRNNFRQYIYPDSSVQSPDASFVLEKAISHFSE